MSHLVDLGGKIKEENITLATLPLMTLTLLILQKNAVSHFSPTLNFISENTTFKKYNYSEYLYLQGHKSIVKKTNNLLAVNSL